MTIKEKAHNYIANSGTTGAINELYVASDLMSRGFSVFRSMSPSCTCDLITMLNDGSLKRVEVKTGHITGSKTGEIKVRHAPCTHNKFDWLAIVLGNPTKSGSIYYLDSNGNNVFENQDISNVVMYVVKK